MESRRKNVSSEDGLTLTCRNTRSCTSSSRRENSLPIPFELILEIFSRLPGKSIARCRCLSKLWASILRRPHFTELFFTRSSARPQLLFSYVRHYELFFFSSPQLQNPDENPPLLAANYLMKVPLHRSFEICGHGRGLVCLEHVTMEQTLRVICNPTTRQSFNLPKMEISGVWRNYFGYDPIDKQFKILLTNRDAVVEHQVMTLGTEELSWRTIESSIDHNPLADGICINGVLYYGAALPGSGLKASMIICFDVRSEKFKSITLVEASFHLTLLNYNGKLGSLVSSCILDATTTSIELWVLQDSKKQEWSKHIYILPALWHNIVGDRVLRFVGVTRTNEIVLSPIYQNSMTFDIFYYSIERNTIRRVGIKGLEAFDHRVVNIYLDHVEDVKLMQEFH